MSSVVRAMREALIAHVLGHPGAATEQSRTAAFENREVPDPLRPLIDKVARHAWKVTDEDVAAARSAGASDDEIFELSVCAALGQASRQFASALAAVEEACPQESAPQSLDHSHRGSR